MLQYQKLNSYSSRAGVVQRLVYKFSKLGTGVRFPPPAPRKIKLITKTSHMSRGFVYTKHMHNTPLSYLVRLEYFAMATMVATFFVAVVGFAWYWLVVLFFAFDISMVGYFYNPRIGAIVYNIIHSLIGPSIFAVIYMATLNEGVLFITLVWLFHIFVDRTLGYGLKHPTGFQHTHMGVIGKTKRK